MDSLLQQVRATIAAHRLLPAGSRVLVGVSGGVDSVALLHLLTQLAPPQRLTLRVAHLDHGLRPASAEDAQFVESLGHQWKVPVTVERQDVGAISREQGWSLEEGARRVRYAFFANTATRYSASHVALAHTADDQAETVLMRMMRGTGLMGLGAMAFSRPLDHPPSPNMASERLRLRIVRPLLEVWRRDIQGYAQRMRLTSREDATNEDRQFMRNRIRHELLPMLEREYNPNMKGLLTQLAEQSQWDYAYLQHAADRHWKRIAKTPGANRILLAVRLFLRQPQALQRQLLRRAIARLRGDVTRFEFRHWLEAERLFRERPVGTVLDLPGGVRLSRETHHVVAELVEPHGQPAPVGPGSPWHRQSRPGGGDILPPIGCCTTVSMAGSKLAPRRLWRYTKRFL